MNSTSLYRAFDQAIQSLRLQNEKWCIALSGGVDSVVLLHLCAEYRRLHPAQPLSAIYINHGLSKQAQSWGQFCHDVCDTLNIEFQSTCVTITPKSRTSLEEQAREARYQSIDQQVEQGVVVLLGQHADDQVETFFLRLKRGSGLKGLGCMKADLTHASGRRYARPLLNNSRDEIEAFATTFDIKHIEDDSNASVKFDRNFLRLEVLPLLKKRFKGFVPSVFRSIELLQTQQCLVDELTAKDLQACVNNGNCAVGALKELSPPRQDNVLRAWLEACGSMMPSQKQLNQIKSQALSTRADTQMQVKLRLGIVRKFRESLYWVTEQPSLAEKDITNTDEIILEDGRILRLLSATPERRGGVRLPHQQEQVHVKFGLQSTLIRPKGKPGHNSVKHWLKEAGVPSWERDRVPLIYYNDQLVEVVGFFVAHDMYREDGVTWRVVDGK